MKKLFSRLGFRKMDEMELAITLKSKNYAQLFTMTALAAWIIYDIIMSAADYDYQVNPLPLLILLISLAIESWSRIILNHRATAGDEEYEATKKRRMALGLIETIAAVVLIGVAAILIAAALRWGFFKAGVLS